MPDLVSEDSEGRAAVPLSVQIERTQAALAEALGRHEHAALQCSGGKDSLTCLHLARPWLDRITVVWVNTGAAFPEAVALMRKVREAVPHFVEVTSDVLAQIARDGPPSDIAPVWNTAFGRAVHAGRRVPIQTPFACCGENIWAPMAKATEATGATLVIRGQRMAELRKAPLSSGHVEDGIEYLFPIDSWSGGQVREYLAKSGVALADSYGYVDTSMDCWVCTAYLDENVPGKYRYLRERHPRLFEQVQQQFTVIASELWRDLDYLSAALAVDAPAGVDSEVEARSKACPGDASDARRITRKYSVADNGGAEM